MKSLVQLAAGALFTRWIGGYVFGTPLYHWVILLPPFVGAMYVTALVQHWIHCRLSKRR